MLRFKFTTSVSFKVGYADVTFHTYLFSYFSKKKKGGLLDSNPGFRIKFLHCSLAVADKSRQRVL